MRISAITSHNDRALLNERVGLEQAAARENLEVYWNGPSNWDVKRQIDLLESAIHSGSFGIAVDPASIFAINTTIRNALSVRIPVVVLLDSVHIAPSPHLYFVLEDTKASATLVSRRLNSLVKGPGEVALRGGDPLLPGAMERYQELETTLRRDCPNLRIDDHEVGPSGSGNLEIGAEQILGGHPHLDAIVALDLLSGLAAYSAVRRDHIQKKIHLIVYDQSDELFILLRRGEIDSLIVQDMRGIGQKAVSDIVADRRGLPAPATAYVEPLLVTQNNIDDQSIQESLQLNLPYP